MEWEVTWIGQGTGAPRKGRHTDSHRLTAAPPPGKFIRMEGRPSMDRKPSSAGSAYTLAGPGGESTPTYIEKAQEQQKLLNEVQCKVHAL